MAHSGFFRRCWRRGLAYFHMYDVGPLSFVLCRGSHHVHDDERRHIAAFGRFQELFCLLKHRFSVRRALGPAPLLPHSDAPYGHSLGATPGIKIGARRSR